jgi:hypothetical protein
MFLASLRSLGTIEGRRLSGAHLPNSRTQAFKREPVPSQQAAPQPRCSSETLL